MKYRHCACYMYVCVGTDGILRRRSVLADDKKVSKSAFVYI